LSKKICPSCNGKNIAKILWGLPGDLDALEEDLDNNKIVLGGCCVSDNDPKWECNDCSHRWR
jgi:hypothetical protein